MKITFKYVITSMFLGLSMINNARKPETTVSCASHRFQNKQVIYIGNSHSILKKSSVKGKELVPNRMGSYVGKSIQACTGSSLEYRAACGNRPRHWHQGKTPVNICGISTYGEDGYESSRDGNFIMNLANEVKNKKPDEVIINLGDNMMTWEKRDGKLHGNIPSTIKLATEIRTLLLDIPKDSNCIWIGPSYNSGGSTYVKTKGVVDKFYEMLKIAINERCDIIDSRSHLSQTQRNDGLHLTQSDSKLWGSKIVESMKDLN